MTVNPNIELEFVLNMFHSPLQRLVYTFFIVHHLTEGEERKKRSGSNPRMISLELIIKSGSSGQENKLTLMPSAAHSRKASVDWLKSLKKVSIV